MDKASSLSFKIY